MDQLLHKLALVSLKVGAVEVLMLMLVLMVGLEDLVVVEKVLITQTTTRQELQTLEVEVELVIHPLDQQGDQVL